MNKKIKSRFVIFLSGIIDAMAVALSIITTQLLIHDEQVDWKTAVVYALLTVLFFYIFDFYTPSESKWDTTIISVILASAAVTVTDVFLILISGIRHFDVWFEAVMMISMIVYLGIWRIMFSAVCGAEKKYVLIVESANAPSRLARKLKYASEYPDRVWYCMIDENNPEEADYIVDHLMEYYDSVFVSSQISRDLLERIIQRSVSLGKLVKTVGNLKNVSVHFGAITNISDTPVIELARWGLTRPQRLIKRTFDIVFSALGIVCITPLHLLLAAIISLDSPGGAIYRQERYTIGKKKFMLYKYRTMYVDAEKNGAQLATKNDGRLTRVGRVIRAMRLDELPQLINVFKGDMSFVGPRPERPVFADDYCRDVKNYELRYVVKAGITGYAQVYGNYVSRASDKILMDLIYASHYSFLLDIKLILMTVRQIFIHTSAEGEDKELEEKLNTPEREAERIKMSFIGARKSDEDIDYNPVL